MQHNPWALALTFTAYFGVTLAIGWYAWRRTANLGDFILGGRRLGSFVAALGAGASDMSGWLLLGLPGLAYASGIESLWLAGGLLLGTWLNWRLVVARLRVFSEVCDDALTLPEYLANRLGDQSGWLRALAALFILFFFLIYTTVGGFLAVSWTDVMQGLLMSLALLIVPAMAVADLGGLDPALGAIEATNPHLESDTRGQRFVTT